MNESLERWGDATPDLFRDAASVYGQDRPTELAQARILAHVELSVLPAGQGVGMLSKLLGKVATKVLLSVIAVATFVVFGRLVVQRPRDELALPRTQQVQSPSAPNARADVRAGTHIPADVSGAAREPDVADAPHKPAPVFAARNADKRRPPVRAQVSAPDASSELALLVRARRILPADPLRAYVLTDQHRASYRDGALREERELLAIEALMALARKEEALTRAARFSRRFPVSVHARRLALILQKAAP